MQSLLASGCWVWVAPPEAYFVKAIRIAEVPRLKHTEEDFYINLWPEHIYDLPVDGELCEVPHICALNAVLVELQFYAHPDHTGTCRRPRLLSDKGIRFLPNNPDQTPPPLRPILTPVYI